MIKIGDFANIFGVSIKTIRFYEEKKLIKPAYVDVYTGYRYYDEKNIEEMSKILAYKSLGFELSEIKDVQKQTIANKIEEYKEKIMTMYSQINTLNSLLNSKEEIKMPVFINDEKAIGKWSLIGLTKTKEDFANDKLLDEDIALKELYLMDDGKEYWVVSWTKGSIIIKGKSFTYDIENNKMYVNLKGLYDEDEKIAVYEKIDDKHYTIDEIRKVDNTDVPFEEDEKLNGLWTCLGTVSDKTNFKLEEVEVGGIIKRLAFFPNGDATITFDDDAAKSTSYTKGFIKDFCIKDTMCSYEIKNVDDKEILVVEWKSGDYVFGGFVCCYYVFEKINI